MIERPSPLRLRQAQQESRTDVRPIPLQRRSRAEVSSEMLVPNLEVPGDRARLMVLPNEGQITLLPEVHDSHVLFISLSDIDRPHEIITEELDRFAGLREVPVIFVAE